MRKITLLIKMYTEDNNAKHKEILCQTIQQVVYENPTTLYTLKDCLISALEMVESILIETEVKKNALE